MKLSLDNKTVHFDWASSEKNLQQKIIVYHPSRYLPEFIEGYTWFDLQLATLGVARVMDAFGCGCCSGRLLFSFDSFPITQKSLFKFLWATRNNRVRNH